MRIFLTGGTGFIGQHLVRSLVERGDECIIISRSGRDPWQHDRVHIIRADPTEPGDWQKEVSHADAVVNLAGKRIVDPPCRWTDARKRALHDSRIKTTRNLADAIRQSADPPAVFVSGSAIGYYGSRGDEILDETSRSGHDFLSRLCMDWEKAALEIGDVAPVTLIRSGIVLGKDGGALASLLPIFKIGLGGPWGAGEQWWSWIHLVDEVAIIRLAIDRRISGTVNLTAPNPVTVNEFAAELGRVLKRPTLLRVPEWLMRLGLGEAAIALLDLQRVVPTSVLAANYEFRFASIDAALGDLLW